MPVSCGRDCGRARARARAYESGGKYNVGWGGGGCVGKKKLGIKLCIVFCRENRAGCFAIVFSP